VRVPRGNEKKNYKLIMNYGVNVLLSNFLNYSIHNKFITIVSFKTTFDVE
jgi:hypothetical protein